MVLNIIPDSHDAALILGAGLFTKREKECASSGKSGSAFNPNQGVMIMVPFNDCHDDYEDVGWAVFCLSLLQIMISNLEMKADMELRGSGFYLYSQDYGTLCFLPSDHDTQIPHGRPLSTAWSSAECHWHRSPSNRSKSSTPATGRPLRHQPQPNKHVPSEGKKRADRNGRRYSDCYSLSD